MFSCLLPTNMLPTSHTWLLSPWNVARMTEALNIKGKLNFTPSYVFPHCDSPLLLTQRTLFLVTKCVSFFPTTNNALWQQLGVRSFHSIPTLSTQRERQSPQAKGSVAQACSPSSTHTPVPSPGTMGASDLLIWGSNDSLSVGLLNWLKQLPELSETLTYI